MGERMPTGATRGGPGGRAPGTTDWCDVLAAVAATAGAAGYGRLASPLLEDADLVRRIVGDDQVVGLADVVDGREVALAPSGAVAAARSFAEHQPATPAKTWSLLTCLDRDGAGRPRQRDEVAVQALGSTDPGLDVEVITLAVDVLDALGLPRPTLVLNSLGTVSDRRRYVEVLRDHLVDRRAALGEADRARAATAPLRVLASRDAATRSVVAGAPRSLDTLSSEGRAHLDAVREGVGAAGIDYLLDHRIAGPAAHAVHVAFELQGPEEAALVTGCRHEGMVEDLGGPPVPGVGWATTVGALLAAGGGSESASSAPVDVFVVDLTGGSAARDLTRRLRRAGIPADRAFDDRSMRAQMKAADRSGARVALIVGEREQARDEVAVHDLRGDGAQTAVASEEVLATVREVLADPLAP